MSFKAYLTVITGILESVLSGGFIFGWSSLDYILTNEGYFNSSCTGNKSIAASGNANSTIFICPSQQYNLELIYTLITVTSTLLNVVGGVIFDYLGTWVIRSIASVLFTFSCLAIAFSTREIAWILYPSAITLGITGFFLFTTNIQTANLFPKARGTILNVLNGALIASIGVTSFVKAAYQDGISLKAIFIFLSFIGLLMLLRTFFLMPKKIFPYDVPENFYFGIKELCNKTNKIEEAAPLLEESEIADDYGDKASEKSLKASMLSSIFMLGTFTVCVQQFRIFFFIEELNSWLEYMMPSSKNEVTFYIGLFGYIQFTGLAFAPLNGLVFDFLTKHYQKKNTLSPEQIKYRVLSVVCTISYCSAVLCAAFILIPSPKLQYATFLLSVISDAYTLGNVSALIIQCFPMRYFGVLYGMIWFFDAIITSLQYPLYYIGVHYYHNNFLVVNAAAFVLVVLTAVHPINLYRMSKKNPKAGNQSE